VSLPLWPILLLQPGALLGATAYVLFRLAGPGIHDRALLGVVAAFAAALSVLLATGERALEGGRQWPLTPLALAEVLAVLVAVDLVDARVFGYAAGVGLPALAVLAGLAGPVIGRGRRRPGRR